MLSNRRAQGLGILVLFCIVAGALDATTRVLLGVPSVLLEVDPKHVVASAALSGGSQALHMQSLRSKVGEECKAHPNCLRQLLCLDGVCSHCNTTEECEDRRESSVCRENDEPGSGTCHHKSLFGPFTWNDFFQIFVTFGTIMFAAPVGIGGGGILVPMYMSLGGFSAHAAIPLSKATILGGAVANNLMNIQRKHPFANRPLLDYDGLQLLVPNLLAGTILGVFVLATTPAWLIVLCIVITLAYNSYTTYQKAEKLYQKEVVEPAQSKNEEQSLLGKDKAEKDGDLPHWSFQEHADPKIKEIIEMESKHSFWTWGVNLVSLLVVLSCAILKGGVEDEQWLECGGVWYFLVALIPLPIMMMLTFHVSSEVNARHEAKVKAGITFAAGEAQWTLANCRMYSALCILAGVGAGCLGIAAGLLVGPMLLQAGMDPVVSVACTGCMILFTASSTSVQYFLLGQLQVDYALFYALIGFVGGVTGNTALHVAVKQWKTKWFVVGLLCGLLVISTVLLAYLGVESLWESIAHGNAFRIRDFCHERPT